MTDDLVVVDQFRAVLVVVLLQCCPAGVRTNFPIDPFPAAHVPAFAIWVSIPRRLRCVRGGKQEPERSGACVRIGLTRESRSTST
jgi:hypothetical protein